jgi:hypothetical protein
MCTVDNNILMLTVTKTVIKNLSNKVLSMSNPIKKNFPTITIHFLNKCFSLS